MQAIFWKILVDTLFFTSIYKLVTYIIYTPRVTSRATGQSAQLMDAATRNSSAGGSAGGI